MSDWDAIDLFAGPGGWDVAARRLGLRVLGFESDDAACATRAAVGHHTVQGDLSTLDPADYLTSGQIGSPPCGGPLLSRRSRCACRLFRDN